MQDINGYIENLQKYKIFKHGNLEYIISTQKNYIKYTTQRQGHRIAIQTPANPSDIIEKVINIYYYYEYNGQPIQMKTLAILQNINKDMQTIQLKRIIHKIKILSEIYICNYNLYHNQ